MNINTLKNNFNKFFKLNKTSLIVLIAVIAVGLLSGVFCAIKLGQGAGLENIQYIMLRKFFLNKAGFFGFFFLSIFIWGCIYLLCFILSCFKVGKYILFLLLFYLSYILGIDVIIIFSCIGGIRGIVFSFICIMPLYLFIIFVLGVFCLKISQSCKTCNGNIFSVKNQSFEIFVFAISIIFLIILLQTLLLLLLLKIFVFL